MMLPVSMSSGGQFNLVKQENLTERRFDGQEKKGREKR